MDPWNKLIRRAQAFRDTLVQASEDASAACAKSRKLTRKEGEKSRESFQDGFPPHWFTEESSNLAYKDDQEEEEEDDEEEKDQEQEEEEEDYSVIDNCVSLEQEHPGDVAEEALLQELFFPAEYKDFRFPSSQKKHKVAEALLDRTNVCLTVNVGKLLLCKNARDISWTPVADIGADPSMPSCLLTLTFPAITAERAEVGCSPEQCISIMPIKHNGHEFVFDHHSQLFWKLSPDQVLSSVWNAQQMMKASIEVATGNGDVLNGHAYLPLQNVVEQSPSKLQLNMVFITYEKSKGNNKMQAFNNAKQDQRSGPRRCQNNSIPTLLNQDGQKPLAILEIGLKLVHGVCDGGRVPILKSVMPTLEETWLYVYIHNGLSLKRCSILHERSKSLMLIVKSGNQSVLRLLYRGSSSRSNCPSQASVGSFTDALLKSPVQIEDYTVFIEVWCSHNRSSNAGSDGLENLLGLAKVSVLEVVDKHKSPEKCILDGFFSLWHPRSNAEGQKLRVTMYRGLKSDMLRVLQETRSAVTIQRHSRMFLARVRKEKARQRPDGNAHNSSQGETLRHVFEVAVQRAKHIPVESWGPGGLFIKYIFPGEDDPLFTHDVELQDTVVFGATAHHRITLAQGQNLVDYLEDVDEDMNGLRFELWSDVMENEKNTHCTVPFEDSRNSEDKYRALLREDQISSCRTEKCIGTAILPMQELLSLLTRIYRDHVSIKIRRLFNLPIRFNKWVECQERTASLIVQVAYDMVELAESHLLDGTIFYDHVNASPLPLKSLLEVMVLDVKVNQAKLHSSLPHMDLPCIRFSLFPCNRELESKHPPIMTYFDEMAYRVSALNITLDALTIKELWESYMTFEVWQRRTKKHEDCASSTTLQQDIRMGVAIAPCVMLISQKQGVSGWIVLVGPDKRSVGCLQVSVKFLRWQTPSGQVINLQPVNQNPAS